MVYGYADASFADVKPSRLSTTGYVFLVNDGAVSWRSSKTPLQVLNAAEAELVSLSSACQELIYLRKLSMECGFPHPHPPSSTKIPPQLWLSAKKIVSATDPITFPIAGHTWLRNSAPKWANCGLSALTALSSSLTSWHPLDLMTHSTSSETKSWVNLLPQPTSFSFEMRSSAWIPNLTVIHITKLNCQLISKGRLLSEITHVTAYSQPNTLTTIPGQGGYLCEFGHFLWNQDLMTKITSPQ
jgi:hypothetical protein